MGDSIGEIVFFTKLSKISSVVFLEEEVGASVVFVPFTPIGLKLNSSCGMELVELVAIVVLVLVLQLGVFSHADEAAFSSKYECCLSEESVASMLATVETVGAIFDETSAAAEAPAPQVPLANLISCSVLKKFVFRLLTFVGVTAAVLVSGCFCLLEVEVTLVVVDDVSILQEVSREDAVDAKVLGEVDDELDELLLELQLEETAVVVAVIGAEGAALFCSSSCLVLFKHSNSEPWNKSG